MSDSTLLGMLRINIGWNFDGLERIPSLLLVLISYTHYGHKKKNISREVACQCDILFSRMQMGLDLSIFQSL